MKIKFTKNYQGRETAMKLYKAGDVDDFAFSHATELIKLKVAKEYEPKPKAVKDDPDSP